MLSIKKGIALSALMLPLLLAGCGNADEKEARYLKKGNEYFDAGDFDKAMVEYKNAAKLKPTEAEPRYHLGMVEEAKGNIRGAFADFIHASEQDPHFTPAVLKLSEYYIIGNHLEEARKRLDEVLAEKPDNAEAYALKAAISLRQKNFSDTEKQARTSLEKDAAEATAYSVLIGLYMVQNDLAKAEATADAGVAHAPKNLSLLSVAARVYERAGNAQKVGDTYDIIFKLQPKEKIYRSNLAQIYLKMNKLDEAQAVLRAGVAAIPNDDDMEHDLVSFLADHIGIDAAEHEIQQYIEADSSREKLTLWLVDLYLHHEQVDKAVALLNEIIAKHDTDDEGIAARTALARIDYIKGDKKAAASLVSSILAKDPNNLDALFIKAHIGFDDGNYESAISDLRNIIRSKPNTKEALQLLSEIYLQQGHLDLAMDTVNQLVNLDPTDYDARIRLAQMMYANNNPKKAMDLLFLVTKENPKFPAAWESAARIAIAAKDWPTAQKAIDNLKALDGQQETAEFMNAQILAGSGKTAEAMSAYKHIIETKPNTLIGDRALAGVVQTYLSLNKVEDAARYIESMKERDAVANTILGECYLKIGKPEPAATAFDAAIAGHAVQQEPYLDRAHLYLAEHKTDQAVETLRKGAEIVPSDVRALIMEAEILGNAQHHAEATKIYETILERSPNLDLVANNLAELIADYEYTDPAALEKARQAAERFITANNPLLLDTLGWVYFRQGNLQQAQTIMDRAMGGGGKLPPQAHYHYGALLLKIGKNDKAKTELQQAVVDGASYPGLDEAKKMLGSL